MASDDMMPETTQPIQEDAPVANEGEQAPAVAAAEGEEAAKSEERDSQSSVVKLEEKEAPTEKKNVKRDRKRKPQPKEEVKGDDGDSKEKDKPEADVVTPRDRPARERKAVDRYWVASPVSRSSGGKPLSIEKGSGTPLREIPNVAFKLSKRKPDDNLQLLHTILYGRKAKVHNLKKDIGQFSGFVWADNEEKQRAKTKEKIDKCVKEKLLDFCDVLNIPINRSTVKKEDLTVKLLGFLESPHATSEELLADKDQKSKSQKRKATFTKSRSSKATSAEKSAKKTQSGDKRKMTSKAEEENETEEIDDNLESQSHSSEEEKDDLEEPESDKEETESEEEKEETKKKVTTSKASKDNSGAKSGKQPMNTDKRSAEKSAKSSAKSEKKAAVSSKKSGTVDASASASSSKAKASASKKQKVEEETEKEKQVPVDEKSTSKKQGSKPASKEQGKSKISKEAKAEPTNEELRAQAVNILKEVDFNTATLSDILKLLGTHFGLDLMHRKVEVKAIITDVIENMSNPDDSDDEDEDEEDSDAEVDGSGK